MTVSKKARQAAEKIVRKSRFKCLPYEQVAEIIQAAIDESTAPLRRELLRLREVVSVPDVESIDGVLGDKS